jgi:K+:H+ antiporter
VAVNVPSLARTAVAYVLMVGTTVALFLFITSFGRDLQAPSRTVAAALPAGVGGSNVLLHLLLALAGVIVAGQLLGRLLALVGQPPVIGEVAAGILLGPSLIGSEASAVILPPAVAPFLGVLAQLGIILYMFLVGLDLRLDELRRRAHLTVATSHASILLPFMLGTALALVLYPRVSFADVPFMTFALFMGVAMSITAFPVLARLLDDWNLTQTELGRVALSCAAVDDVTAWCLLAFVVGIVEAEPGEGIRVAIGAVAYIAVMLFVARPLLRRYAPRWDAGSTYPVAALLVALLASAAATEAIGIHAIFGAFVLGAVVPPESPVARALGRQMRDLVTILLLPAFFAFTGMRTRIDLLSGAADWIICLLIIAVATAGKFGGTFVAARLSGMRPRDAAMLGALMNTRGLMELIVLNIGLELGVISPPVFAMMVLMALATTMSTAPMLAWLKR